MARYGWVAAALLAAACGSGRGTGQGPEITGNGPPGGGTAPSCAGRVTVRLRGTGATTGTFDVDLGGLEASANGAALIPAWAASGPLALAAPDGAKLALLDLGGREEPIDLTLRLARVHVCRDSACVDPDVCAGPLHVRFDPRKVNPETCELAIRLDLAQSVKPLPRGGETFLPRISFRY